MFRRTVLILAATVAAAAALGLLPATVQARTAAAIVQLQPDATSDVTQTARPGALVPVHYVMNTTNALSAVTFQTDQDRYLPAQGDLRVDGAAVPFSQSGGKDLTGSIATLAAGGHDITFTARMSSSATARTSSTASLTWTDDAADQGTTPSSVAYVVDPARPDLFVNTAGKGHIYVLSHSVGTVPARVALHNTVAVDTSFTVTVTRGFTITGGPRFVSGTPAPCVRGPMHATCRITATQLAQGAKTLITPVSGPSGSTGRAYLSVASANHEPDVHPADNSANVPVTVVRTADIQLAWNHGNVTLSPGGTVSFRISIHNHGPDAAHVVFGAGLPFSTDNVRVAFSGPGIRRYPDRGAEFDLGVLRPGATTAITAVVTTPQAGSYGYLAVAYDSSAYDPTYCIDSDCQLAGYRTVSVTGGANRATAHTVRLALPASIERKFRR